MKSNSCQVPNALASGGAAVPDPRWHWRNCRSIGFKFHFWLWPWMLGTCRSEDVYGGERGVSIGPFSFGIAYSIGNASAYGLEWFTALDETTAARRAAGWEDGQP